MRLMSGMDSAAAVAALGHGPLIGRRGGEAVGLGVLGYRHRLSLYYPAVVLTGADNIRLRGGSYNAGILQLLLPASGRLAHGLLHGVRVGRADPPHEGCSAMMRPS